MPAGTSLNAHFYFADAQSIALKLFKDRTIPSNLTDKQTFASDHRYADPFNASNSEVYFCSCWIKYYVFAESF